MPALCSAWRGALDLYISALDVSYVTIPRVAASGMPCFPVRRAKVLPNAAGAAVSGPVRPAFNLRILFCLRLSFSPRSPPPTADWGVMWRENSKGLLYGLAGSFVLSGLHHPGDL